jgi:hypothetical protein
MSDMIIIVKKVKGVDEQNQRLIKISEMLKKPLKKPADKSPKKSIFNSGNSYFSMFLQPIDQQYSQNLFEDNQENPNILGKLDILNYSTDSSEEFQKKVKVSENINLTARGELSASARRSIPLQAKRGITTPIREIQKIQMSYNNQMARYHLAQFNLMANKISKNQNKNKFTKLLKPGWQIQIATGKNKSFQKYLFHIRMQVNMSQNPMKNRNLNNNFNPHQVNFRFPQSPIKISSSSNNSSNLLKSELNITSVINKSKNIEKQGINKNINFTCNNNKNRIIHSFPLSKVCEYKHACIKIDKNVINKIKYRRPLSVD